MKKISVLFLAALVLVVGFLYFNQENKDENEKKIIKKDEEKNEPVVKKEEEKKYELNLFMVGDALIHKSVYKDAYIGNNQYNFKPMLSYIEKISKNSDLAYYNQESIIGGKDLGLSAYPRFNSPDEIGENMVELGFNLVSLANNHTLDQGKKGIMHSTSFWETKDVIVAGSYSSEEKKDEVVIKEKNNITYAMLSYTTLTNGLKIPNNEDYLVDLYNEEKVKKDIEKLRDKVDLLMVAMHWGTEYTHKPTEGELEIAKFLADQNVDIIIGSHPHVIQPIDYIDDTLVIYSLGNFISAQDPKYTSRMVGLMANVEISKTVKGNSKKIKIEKVNADLIYNKFTNWRNFKLYPFSELNEGLLKDHQSVYKKYSDIVTSLNDNVIMTSLYK